MIESPLAAIHQDLVAKFAEFGGWEMPLEYAGVLAEHEAVRTRVGLFDVSHLGTFLVEGDGAVAYLNTRLSNDLGRITPGQAQYTLLLDESGGVVDDMIVYVRADDDAMVIPNAANASEVMARLMDSSPEHLSWTNRHHDDAIIAIQGPKSAQVMADAGFPHEMDYMSFEQFSFHQSTDGTCSGHSAEHCESPWRAPQHHDADRGRGACVHAEVKEVVDERSEEHRLRDSQNPESTVDQPSGASFTICRTGYTGELGYELVVPAVMAEAMWTQLMEAGEAHGIQPCGLGARDTLRLEMGYPLHGQDLSLKISPVEARVGWAVGWKKDRFDGHVVVRTQKSDGVDRTLLGIRCVGRGIPRAHMEVVDSAGGILGEVTSGTFSPTLKLGIGLALLPSTTQVGDRVLVQIRNRTEEFEVVRPPFVTTHVRN
ncbi:MAG: glycine cleavage system protein T [Propionibacteriaceae bacterium]|nr:glycine cleavage system protein T [Propionibacteriaceae bacterium]